MRHHRFGISEIGNLSTSFSRMHPHWLWKTITRRATRADHFFVTA